MIDESPVRDVVTWTTMIDGFAKHGLSDEAVEVFDLMLLSDVQPNEITMITMLSAFGTKGDIRTGKQIYDYITMENVYFSLNLTNATLDTFVKCGYSIEARKIFDDLKTKDVFSWTSMVNGYVKRGKLDAARKVFDGMPEKNAVSWNAMIAGYSQNDRPKEALKLFHDMIRVGLVPTEHTLVCVLSACGQLGCLDLGQWIHHHHINPKGIRPSVILSNAVMDMCAKFGSIDSATSLFSEISERDLVSWNTIIAGYAAHGYAKQALILFEQMKRTKLEPDCITFVAVLLASSHDGTVVEINNFSFEPQHVKALYYSNYLCFFYCRI